MNTKLDFLIAGSATDAFYSQIAFFRLSLDRLGGEYKNARLVAVLGNHKTETIPARWKPYYSNIEVVWAHKVGEENEHHRYQHYKRFELIRDDADLACICDADTLLIRPFPELIQSMISSPSIAGVLAHYHFPWSETSGDSVADWQFFSKKVIGRGIKCNNKYTLYSSDSERLAPFYVNYGFIAGTPTLLRQLYKEDLTMVDTIDKEIEPFWSNQIALPLVISNLGLPTQSLPMRYNFPNDPIADEKYPEELKNVTLIHYLRKGVFDRHRIFATALEFNKFLNLKLEGSNLTFQKHCFDLTKGKYPFPDRTQESNIFRRILRNFLTK